MRKEWQRAINDFDVALLMKPDAATTRFFRARSRAEVGDFDGSISDFEAVLRLQPKSADAYWNLGVIHGFRGDFELAVSSYREAYALDPNRYPGLVTRIAELQFKADESRKGK